jgi:hypothetical protein
MLLRKILVVMAVAAAGLVAAALLLSYRQPALLLDLLNLRYCA